MNIDIDDLKQANEKWFDGQNQRFFNDVDYFLDFTGTGAPVLIRSTYAWTDMFGAPRRLHYRFNWIDPETLKIKSLDDTVFDTMDELKEFIQQL